MIAPYPPDAAYFVIERPQERFSEKPENTKR